MVDISFELGVLNSAFPVGCDCMGVPLCIVSVWATRIPVSPSFEGTGICDLVGALVLLISLEVFVVSESVVVAVPIIPYLSQSEIDGDGMVFVMSVLLILLVLVVMIEVLLAYFVERKLDHQDRDDQL